MSAPELPRWLDGLTHRDFLCDGSRCTPEQWADLDWTKAYINMGPSPVGNPGPYWHVPKRGADTVHRLYPRVLQSKWLPLIRRAVGETAKQSKSRKYRAHLVAILEEHGPSAA